MFPKTLIRFRDPGELSLASPCLPEAQKHLSSVLSAQCLLLPVPTGAAGLWGGVRINPSDSKGLDAAPDVLQVHSSVPWGLGKKWKMNWKHNRRTTAEKLHTPGGGVTRSFPRVMAQAWQRPGHNNWTRVSFPAGKEKKKNNHLWKL